MIAFQNETQQIILRSINANIHSEVFKNIFIGKIIAIKLFMIKNNLKIAGRKIKLHK